MLLPELACKFLEHSQGGETERTRLRIPDHPRQHFKHKLPFGLSHLRQFIKIIDDDRDLTLLIPVARPLSQSSTTGSCKPFASLRCEGKKPNLSRSTEVIDASTKPHPPQPTTITPNYHNRLSTPTSTNHDSTSARPQSLRIIATNNTPIDNTLLAKMSRVTPVQRAILAGIRAARAEKARRATELASEKTDANTDPPKQNEQPQAVATNALSNSKQQTQVSSTLKTAPVSSRQRNARLAASRKPFKGTAHLSRKPPAVVGSRVPLSASILKGDNGSSMLTPAMPVSGSKRLAKEYKMPQISDPAAFSITEYLAEASFQSINSKRKQDEADISAIDSKISKKQKIAKAQAVAKRLTQETSLKRKSSPEDNKENNSSRAQVRKTNAGQHTAALHLAHQSPKPARLQRQTGSPDAARIDQAPTIAPAAPASSNEKRACTPPQAKPTHASASVAASSSATASASVAASSSAAASPPVAASLSALAPRPIYNYRAACFHNSTLHALSAVQAFATLSHPETAEFEVPEPVTDSVALTASKPNGGKTGKQARDAVKVFIEGVKKNSRRKMTPYFSSTMKRLHLADQRDGLNAHLFHQACGAILPSNSGNKLDGDTQEDVDEYFRALTDKLDEEQPALDLSSTFRMEFEEQLQCKKCSNVKIVNSTHDSILGNIPENRVRMSDHVGLQQLFMDNLKADIKPYQCDECAKQVQCPTSCKHCQKRKEKNPSSEEQCAVPGEWVEKEGWTGVAGRRLTVAPEFLRLRILRERMDNRGNTVKVHTKIDLSDAPITLYNQDRSQVKYRLVAAIEHHGKGARSGHYTALRKVGGQWFHCDDANSSLGVEEIDTKDLLKHGGAQMCLFHKVVE